MVKTCKSIWIEEKEKREQLDENFSIDEVLKDKLTKQTKRNEMISAILSYSKGEYLKLIPFIRPPP